MQRFIQALLEEEVTELLGRTKSARREAVAAPSGYRNGYGKPWRCTIADGHLGLGAALGEQYPQLAEQRCWNHKITNVLDALPKKYQAEARTLRCALPYAETQAAGEALIALATEQGFPYWLALGTILHGWALAEQGQGEKGIAQIRQGIAAYEATEAECFRPYYLALLAEAQGKVGQGEEGLSVLAEALATANKTEERFHEAELYRLKGTLTLQSKTSLGQVSGKSQTHPNKSEDTDPRPLTLDPQTEAEAYFLKAIEIAREQQAKSLELRAATSLARLWQQQGKQNEAHSMLAEIYGWFTEGFDTKDLQEAKVLLEELQSEV